MSRTARTWWQTVCSPEAGDPAIRARLRRARSALDVLSVPAAVVLARRLGASRTPDAATKAIELARVLAHVRRDDERSPMQAAGWPRFPLGGDAELAPDQRPVLSETRFRRLIRAERGDGELAEAFIRLVRLLDGDVNVGRLAEAFWYWDGDADRIRRMWAFEYYAAGIAAPPAAIVDVPAPALDEDSDA